VSQRSRRSAGILLYRPSDGPDGIEVLLAHPGGPLFATRDADSWTIPKGEIEPDETPWDVARREFAEETGHPAPDSPPIDLGEIQQKGGKWVVGWALAGDLDPTNAVSNTFTMEWPPRSGRLMTVPEIDRVAWFGPAEARQRIKAAQIPFIDRLLTALGRAPSVAGT
jgi:predicted NUDIX family NTP pyrophosphohydrolase